MHVFFSVGEPSGDQHAALLIRELQRRHPGIRCSGFGGPLMEQAGLESLHRLTERAVMGFGSVIPQYFAFRRLAAQAREFLRRERPDMCVLVDFPGFNWHIARSAKQAGAEVVYYLPPQLWAWGTWRLRKLRRSVDRVLSVLPFEAEWYRSRGVTVDDVGHPFFDEVAAHRLDAAILAEITMSAPRRVALLPGSRDGELRRNLPVMLDAVRQVSARHPDVRFPMGCYKPAHREYCRSTISRLTPGLPIDLYCGQTSEVIEGSQCALMVSGSISLEMLARERPAVAMYGGGLLMGLLVPRMIHCKYMSLPNLMVDRPLMPEVAFYRNLRWQAQRIAAALDRWLSDAGEMARTIEELRALKSSAAGTGGIARAAESLLAGFGRSQRIPSIPAAALRGTPGGGGRRAA